MRRLELTLASPAENLALDEALLDELPDLGPVLRIWEPTEAAVVLGRASKVDGEVDREYCRRNSIPVLRRCSGGATVVTMPGCLMYAVTLSTDQNAELADVDQAHRFVLERLKQALQQCGVEVVHAGSSDLVFEGRKFSGNSLRCKRGGLLYHGTLLYDADLDRIAACLQMPSRQPEYRQGRSHGEFLTNLPVDGNDLHQALVQAWEASQTLDAWPQTKTSQLATDRYTLDSWNLQR